MNRAGRLAEEKAASAVIDAVSNVQFNAALFAGVIEYAHPAIQQRVGNAIFYTIDALADAYVAGNVNRQNYETLEYCYRMREAIRQQGLEFPPQI